MPEEPKKLERAAPAYPEFSSRFVPSALSAPPLTFQLLHATRGSLVKGLSNDRATSRSDILQGS
jgi:hypothetical protein